MLNALLLPLMFSMAGGTYVYLQLPDRRAQGLLILTLFQLVGAVGYVMEPTLNLFMLLSLHASVVLVLLVRHLQAPAPVQQPGEPRR
ncbi:hypothetical protein GCM10008959_07960 [Deinococcus seoulensis]|uniref:Uncharacterized protein n=1 Tax=Deinococcus seoulensis TaxID=1837379 RepID=A0ABQ2RN72_9DEIO|nr:hypothetical protein [Deinococcus seoulensis]GGR49174.1 hypothetical protein GCM10008959_07960 [Deinococcus seoulensis]